ncbi:TetR/AcrR family transcriptional regulator [Arthrobacter sp.]|uniref:TetR/AcrR family transcriptional regulator n=1 Tax=Arthrobacter sp. TaxID=1667 RepID=UPI003A94AA9A
MDQTLTVPEPALRLLVERGFDATSVDQLAGALGMSRSTFFRRYGTKEDMVFSDMDPVIDAVQRQLAVPGRGIAERVSAAALAVFDHHTSRPEASALRFRLVHEVPSLRDRELVSTHRYERAFRRGIRAALGVDPGLETAQLGVVAYAAAVVAVHNAFLRSWLSDPDDTLRGRLSAELAQLAALFLPRIEGTGPVPDPAGGGRVVVAVADAGANTGEVIEAVRQALEAGDTPARPTHR